MSQKNQGRRKIFSRVLMAVNEKATEIIKRFVKFRDGENEKRMDRINFHGFASDRMGR
jgi:hypothetical protein